MNGYQTLLYKGYWISSIKFSQTELDSQNLQPSKFCTYTYNAKQKHLGYKKVLSQLEAALQISATKNFDISWGQKVTYQKSF